MSRRRHTRAELAAALAALGLRRGDCVVVHSSLRSFGVVDGGADAVVDALLDTVGVDGLLVVPTFTYDTARFDAEREPARTGAVAEAARRRPQAVRSLHPTHSVAAIGRGARELCAGHELLPATGVGSPLDRLAARGGLVLLLGVGHTANTTVHVGEFHAGAPYLDIPFSPEWPRAHEIAFDEAPALAVAYDRFPGCSRSFGVVERGLRERGAVLDGAVGAALAQLIPGAAVIDETVALLQRDPTALLCSEPACSRCACARAQLKLVLDARGRGAGADLGR